jgi:sugar lactone lactonase YvrE
MVDLAATIEAPGDDAAFFANDVAVGPDGTAYVTDTRMNAIYRVSPGYEASLLRRFDGFSPNGIVYHPDGYLLAGGGTALWKVPVDDPAAAAAVTLPEEVPGQDGLVWTTDGRLAIVSNSDNRVVALRSEDGWATAELAGVAPFAVQATTAAAVGSGVYVVHPHFNDAEPPSVARVTFE